MAKINADAHRPLHPFRVFFSSHPTHPPPLTKASLSLTVPPLSPALPIGEVRGRQASCPGAGGAEKTRETRFHEDNFTKRNQ